METFRELSQTLADLGAIRDHLPADQQAPWDTYLDTLRTKFDDLDAGDKAAVSTFQTLIETQKPPRAPKSAGAGGGLEGMPSASEGIARVPEARQVSTPARDAQVPRLPIKLPEWLKTWMSPDYAEVRLTIFSASAWLATMAVLVWTGMEQLYWSKPTFGSGSDYFTLLGWGFGSNASSSTIVQAFNGSSKPLQTPAARQG